ncbi:hypothetical protein B0T21DRAFT_374543 [Apiosordaria backusii]|uniref:BZIP domain-containing protein n=1 Tax=Apiosordaria backusii TaxID=314023 RepID=A0AA40DWJ1_9PEZI|nr:hypothetical protein B0T21DRAFT_374543 [Apiosordaria backusii]
MASRHGHQHHQRRASKVKSQNFGVLKAAHHSIPRTFDSESAPPTCFSSEDHPPEAIRDHTKHYFGCINIADRANYFADPDNNPIWQHELKLEKEYLTSLPEYKGREDLITQTAKRRRDKTIESTAVAIEAQYRRTDILRQAVRGKTPDQPPVKAPPGSCPQQPPSLAKTDHFVTCIEESGKNWRNSPSYICGITKVQAWKQSQSPPVNNPLGVSLGTSTPNNQPRASSTAAADTTARALNIGPQSRPELGRDEVRRIVERIRKSPPPLDSKSEEYDLERDVNAYLIQYTRRKATWAGLPAVLESKLASPQTGASTAPGATSASASAAGAQEAPSDVDVTAAPEPCSNIVTSSPTRTTFPNGTTSRTSSFSPTQSTHVQYLEPYEEELTDSRFKGRFPDQRLAMNVVLGADEDSTTSPSSNTPNILDREAINADDPTRIRYFHLPSNNMHWVEKAIAAYFGEGDLKIDLTNASRDRSVRTHTQMLLRPQFWRGQQHGARSGVVHARHMRPLCERISSEVNEIEDNPKNIVLFMPYLHWDTDRMRNKMAKMIDIESEQQRKRNEAAAYEKRQKRMKLREGLEPGAKRILHKDDADQKDNTTSQTGDHKPSTGPSQGVNDLADLMDRLVSIGRSKQKIEIDENGRLKINNPLGQYLIDAARLYEAISTYRDQRMLEKYLYNDPPLHPRRTLDQSYYWTLKSTKVRDRDQVVYRGTNMNLEFCHRLEPQQTLGESGVWSRVKGKLHKATGKEDPKPDLKWTDHWEKTDDHGCEHCRSDIRKISQLVMVDQLWMWVLDERTIITSFPKRYGFNKQDLSGVHKSIRMRLKSARKNQVRSVYDLALIILDECCNTFFDRTKTEDSQPQVMDIFSESIGNVTNQHTISFQHVWHWTQKASKIYRSRSKYIDSSDLHVPLLDIHPEGKLQREVKDIIDELDIMIHVHKKQREVVKRFCKHVEHILDPDGQWKEGADQYNQRMPPRVPNNTIDNMDKYQRRRERHDQLLWFRMQSQELLAEVDDRLDELEGLKKGAESTAQSVNDLLSLKQQQASVVQAWESVKQAEEAVRQGRAIMMFTVITIIFLPLSFIASIFGMNNYEFGGSDNPWSVWDQLEFILPISFGVIFISVVVAFSNLLRAFIWSLFKLITTSVLVYSGLYRFWLTFSDEWCSTSMMQKTEKMVQDMKDEVRRVKKQRRNQRNQKRKKKEQEIDKKDKDGHDTRNQKGEDGRHIKNANGNEEPTTRLSTDSAQKRRRNTTGQRSLHKQKRDTASRLGVEVTWPSDALPNASGSTSARPRASHDEAGDDGVAPATSGRQTRASGNGNGSTGESPFQGSDNNV